MAASTGSESLASPSSEHYESVNELHSRLVAHSAEASAMAREMHELSASISGGAGGVSNQAHIDDSSGTARSQSYTSVLDGLLQQSDQLHGKLAANVKSAGDTSFLELKASVAVPESSTRPSATGSGTFTAASTTGTGGSTFDSSGCFSWLSSDEGRTVFSALRQWGFPIFEASRKAPAGFLLRTTAWACIQDLKLVEKLNLDATCVQNWLSLIEEHYHFNPYHNATHVADVTQTTHYFLQSAGLAELLTPVQQYSLLLAAVAHDVGHPGVNNGYLVNSRHPLATVYNDASPLENMHAALAFDLATRPGCDPLTGLSDAARKSARGDIIHCILGTDNAQHFGNLKLLKDALQAAPADAEEGAFVRGSAQLVMQQVLHAADVSNPAKPWEVYMGFTERLVYEYYALGDLEGQAQLPVTPMLDRSKPIPMPDFQLGFLNAIVLPLFSALATVPGLKADTPLQQLKDNIAEWQRKKDAASQA